MSGETKWTTGPWRVNGIMSGGATPVGRICVGDYPDRPWPCTVVTDGTMHTVAIVPARDANEEPGTPSRPIANSDVATARLIAAAPDLYAALAALEDAAPLVPGNPAMRDARAALAKARGDQ